MPTTEPKGPGTLRRDARANRDRILAAARESFAAEGVDVPVEAIARRARVGMGTLYRRFPTKQDLLDVVLEEALDEFVTTAEACLAESDPWTGLTRFLERGLELHAENRALRVVLATEEHGRAHVEAARERVRPLVAELIDRAHASGTLRADFTPEDLPLVFWTASRVIEAASPVAPDLWRRYLGLLVDGLRTEAATPLPRPPLTRADLDRLHARRNG